MHLIGRESSTRWPPIGLMEFDSFHFTYRTSCCVFFLFYLHVSSELSALTAVRLLRFVVAVSACLLECISSSLHHNDNNPNRSQPKYAALSFYAGNAYTIFTFGAFLISFIASKKKKKTKNLPVHFLPSCEPATENLFISNDCV